jgi:GH25 family lysozyme M1 (1,4-beta-N-acetylmuramidase)
LPIVTALRAAAAGGVTVALSLAAVPGAHAAGTLAGSAATATPVRGLDISAYQHAGSPIDWALLVRRGIRFVAVKISEGTYYLNPYYQSDARAAAAAGLPVLSYVFATPNRATGTATADFAVAATGYLRGSARLPLVVDLENDPYAKAADCYGLGIPAMIAWIARFTAQAEALTGKRPVIYTAAAWWQQCTGSTGQFRRDPLWLAAFDGTPPTVPSPWPNWTFWQYDNAGSLPGIGHADLDYYQPTSGLPALRSPVRRESRKREPAKHKKTPKAAHPVKSKKKSKKQLRNHRKA